jgi:hypothetical protein
MKCALSVLDSHKKLLLFPLLTLLFLGIIALFFILPIVLWDTGYSYSDSAHWNAISHRWLICDQNEKVTGMTPAGYVLMAAIYLLSTFLATFFNVAFYSQIFEALEGRSVSIRGGFQTAFSRLKAIIVWSLFTGVVGLAIRALEERVGIVGRWIVGFLGIAWSVASIFVVPAIIMEPESNNPLHFLKNSASLLRKTWGESLLGYVGFQFGQTIIFLGSLAFLGVGIVLSILLQTYLLMTPIVIIWLVVLITLRYFLTVASEVFRGALYLYAAKGKAPSPFDEDQMSMAWKMKKSNA